MPLLEHYFAENPLPTHADKNFLAKKCGMTFRQIHVWVRSILSRFPFVLMSVYMQFQNRRNRTRKEGQVFKRKPQHEPGKLPLDTLIAKMPHSIIPKDQRVKYVDSDSSEYEWQYESSEDDVVRPVAPPLSLSDLYFISVWLGGKTSSRFKPN